MVDTSIFNIITPFIYWMLVVSWCFIFLFYVKRIRNNQYQDKMLTTLLVILCLDSMRTLFESSYFGLRHTSLAGMISPRIYDFLIQPHMVFFPKIINMIVSLLIIFILIRRWLPQESLRLKDYKKLIYKNDLIIKQLPLAVLITDLEGCIEFVNPGFCEMTGYTSKEVLGKNPRILNSGSESVTDYPILWDTISSGKTWTGFFYNKKRNGDLYWESASISPLQDTDGTITHYIAIKEDITEKKHLDEERGMLLTAMEQSYDSVEILDRDRKIQYVNKAFENRMGYSKEELIGKTPGEFFYKSTKKNEEIDKQAWAQLEQGKLWTGIFTNITKDGHFFEEEVNVTPVYNKTGDLINFVSVKRDITEKIKAEKEQQELKEQLFHAQRVESVGQLAGGVAHDFNNIIGVIITAAQLLEDPQRGLDERGQEFVRMILDSSHRAADLTSSLLSYSRRSKSQSTSFSFTKVIKETENLLKYSIDLRISIISDLHCECDFIYGDRLSLMNVLLNLAINASHAIEDQGTITIRLRNKTVDQFYCDQSQFEIEPGKYCFLEFEDDGCGISESSIHQIFEPFFTTKSEGKGTGLGLSSVMRAIVEYSGEVTVSSRIGEGTVFNILLPCTEVKPDT